MDETKIIDVNHWHYDDFDELNILVKPKSGPAFYEIVDEERDFYLIVIAKTNEVVGATITEADHWFDELAEAFQRRDLSHPDVRFFLEQKIRVFAAEWAEQHDTAPEPAHAIAKKSSPYVTARTPARAPTHAIAEGSSPYNIASEPAPATPSESASNANDDGVTKGEMRDA